MSTARDLITRAFYPLGLASTAKPANPNNLLEGLFQLQNLLSEWAEDNILLGTTLPNTLDDEVNEPDWSSRAISMNLAVNYAESGRATASLSLIRTARSSKTFIQGRASPTPVQLYPDSLPLGQGNKQWPGVPRFFPIDDQILAENAGNIISEGS